MTIAQVQGQGPVYVPPVRQEGDLRVPRIGAEAILTSPHFLVRVWNASVQTANGMFGKISRIFFAALNWIRPVLGARVLAFYTYVCAVWKGVQGQIREEALQQNNAQLAARVEDLTHEKNNLAAALALSQENNVRLGEEVRRAVGARDEAIAAKANQDPEVEHLRRAVLNLGNLQRIGFEQRDQMLNENLQLRNKLVQTERELLEKEEDIHDLEVLNNDLEEEVPQLREKVVRLQWQLADYNAEAQLPGRYDVLNTHIVKLIAVSKELKEQGGNNPGPYEEEVEKFLEMVQKKREEFLQGLERVKEKLLPDHVEAHALVTMIGRVTQMEEQFLRASMETVQARAARHQPLQQLFQQIQFVPQKQIGVV